MLQVPNPPPLLGSRRKPPVRCRGVECSTTVISTTTAAINSISTPDHAGNSQSRATPAVEMPSVLGLSKDMSILDTDNSAIMLSSQTSQTSSTVPAVAVGTLPVSYVSKELIDESNNVDLMPCHDSTISVDNYELPVPCRLIPRSNTCTTTIVTTPSKSAMKKQLKRIHTQRWKLKRRVKSLSESVAKLKRQDSQALNRIDSILSAAAQYLTPLQLEFFRCQMENSQRKRRGRRWPLKVKLFALQLQYKSPSAYRFLSEKFAMPSSDTLTKFVNNSVGQLQPGFSSTMLQITGLRAKELPLCDRQCSLVFDEISLKCELTYNKHFDRIVGYTDKGLVATHALVFMVRGLGAKWKQAVGYFSRTIPLQLRI